MYEYKVCSLKMDCISGVLVVLCTFFNAAASGSTASGGSAWGQTGPWAKAVRTPDQWTGGRVGENLRERGRVYVYVVCTNFYFSHTFKSRSHAV